MRPLLALAAVLLLAPSVRAEQRITLNVPVVLQQTQVWCWLAVSEMIVKYYKLDHESPQQCQMVAAVRRMPATLCCSGSPQCVTPGGIGEIAALIEHYTGYRPTVVNRPDKPSDIVKALKKNKVIIAALPNSNGGGHVVIVRGIQRNNDDVQLLINDPMSPRPYIVEFERFKSGWREAIIVQFSADKSDDSDEGDN